jgi:uncharacterized metal-binding protein YceD (DUF177 family)
MTPPELSRITRLEHIGEGVVVEVEASSEERAAIAERLGIVSVDALRCRFDLHRELAGTVHATGTLRATVVQTCVVSVEAFETTVDEDFVVNFVPAGSESEELDLDAEDEIPYADGVLDLGEATTEQLALALDPFPRKPGATLPEDGGAVAEGPFAALQNLRSRE